MMFFHPQNEGRGSPTNYLRNQLLFHEDNRGVYPRSDSPEIEPSTTLGIVSKEYCPPEFIDYFSTPIEPAGVIYRPNEDSYVAKYLRKF